MFAFLPTRSSIFKSPSLTETDADILVSSIIVVGTPTPPVYHFRMSLVDAHAQKGVRLDMSPSYLDFSDPNIGVVLVERMQSVAESSDSENVPSEPFQLPLKHATTVKELLTLFFNRNSRDRYRFNEQGQGCRHWCATLVGDLEQAGLLSFGASVLFQEWEDKELGRLGIEAFPMPRIRGEFY